MGTRRATLLQLVKLLKHLNIMAVIKQSEPDLSHAKSSNILCPMLLQIKIFSFSKRTIPTDPASLMIQYKCGFVPIGLFPATIANLIGNDSFTLIIRGIKKNRVWFRFGADRDMVTFIF